MKNEYNTNILRIFENTSVVPFNIPTNSSYKKSLYNLERFSGNITSAEKTIYFAAVVTFVEIMARYGVGKGPSKRVCLS